MNENKREKEDVDEGTSLEKEIENLNKDDPLYDTKRDKLMEQLQIFRKKFEKKQLQIKQQQQEISETFIVLRDQVSANPENIELKNLLKIVQLDKKFLDRAIVEMVSIKGNIDSEFKRLDASKKFNQPIDIKIITDIDLKPLPSSRIKEKGLEIKNNNPSKKTKPIGHKLAQLRSTTAPKVSYYRDNTRQRERIH